MKKTTILMLFFLLTYLSYSQNIDKVRLDSFISKIEKYEQGMGSISIFENGKEVYQRVYGFENIENGIRATEKSKYCIGSITKSFTATIIMQLIEENKLSLETKVANYFPEIQNSKEITIEQLLRHRSGLYNYANSPDFHSWSDTLRTKAEMIDKFIKNGTNFEPGEKSKYCNTGYVLLSYIAQKIEGKEYDEILKERIAKPLNLKSTYYSAIYGMREHEALSYFKYGTWELGGVANIGNYDGAGGIVSTPTDLNTFFYALYAGKIISDKCLSEMEKIVDGYGIGMYEMPFYERISIGHAGDIGGFQSASQYYPEDNLLLSFTSNGTGMSRNDILEGILSISFGKEYDFPDFTNYKISDNDLDKYLGSYSNSISSYKLIFTKKNGMLLYTPTDQPSLPMEAIDRHKFRFSPLDLNIEFIPKEDKIIVSQGGDEVFYKEK